MFANMNPQLSLDFQYSSSDPDANRGAARQDTHGTLPITGHLDYLVVVGHCSDGCKSLEAQISKYFRSTLKWDHVRGATMGKHYESVGRSSEGIILCSNSLDNGLEEYRISIPGIPLGKIPASKLLLFGRWLLQGGARCTRFDWAVDDYNKYLSLDTISKALSDGNYARFASYKDVRSGARNLDAVGRTLYLGSMKSDRLIRIYDKEVESHGAVKSIRYEIQTRDELAHSYFCAYCSHDDAASAARSLSSSAIAAVDFVDRSQSSRLDRCERLDWWAAFVALVDEGIRIRSEKRSETLTRKKQWVERQVIGTLAIIKKCIGVTAFSSWLNGLIRDRLFEFDEDISRWVSDWRRQRSVFCIDELGERWSLPVVFDWG